jgi:hypothetical protein
MRNVIDDLGTSAAGCCEAGSFNGLQHDAWGCEQWPWNAAAIFWQQGAFSKPTCPVIGHAHAN